MDFVRLNDGVWLHVRTAEQGHDRDSGTETRGLHASQQADGSWVVEEPVRWVTDIEEDAESNEGDDFA